MEIYTDYNSALEEALRGKRFAIAHLTDRENKPEIYVGNCSEIYYSISGGKTFYINERQYDIIPGNVFITNDQESRLVSQHGGDVHERLILLIHPDYFSEISTGKTSLQDCFLRNGKDYSHRLELNWEEQSQLRALVYKIGEAKGYGADVLENGACSELLVMFNRLNSGLKTFPIKRKGLSKSAGSKVDKVLAYVNKHLLERLLIRDIALEFKVSEAYICKIFKSETGITLNKYISARRIAVAKTLLTQGKAVAEVYKSSGWGDYSNFCKTFSHFVGISPKQYAKMKVNIHN